MPRMSGHQVLDVLRRIAPGTRVIVLTGHQPDTEKWPEIAGVLQKPIGLGELTRSVRSALDA